ncbi:glycosyltransferase [Tropicimonas sp.]|uniref:glycosyltransferase n=1 Tax=Tropicimonas sp. TaxID=2067044 RepID=UPI003A863D59
MDNASEISVIIVNYGTPELAAEAVESVLARDHGGRRVDVHIVDNASPGDDVRWLERTAAERGWGPRVTLYPEQVNHGFGRGNNCVLRRLRERPEPPDKVFLLNPDARLDNEAVEILAGVLDRNPGVGSAGTRISMPDGRPVTAAFRFPSLASDFSQSLGFGPLNRLLGRWSVPLSPECPTGPVDWVSGAAVMFRFDAIAQAGFFDPDYFLYHEEVDLMWRLKRNGWTCWHVAEARVVHAEGAATQVRGRDVARRPRPDYWYDSRRLLLLKTRGRGGALAAALAVTVGAALNHAMSVVKRRQVNLPQNFIADHWRLVTRPLLTGLRRPK